MSEFVTLAQVALVGISSVAGTAFGIGIGVQKVKSKLGVMEEKVGFLDERQKKLRGETNGGKPLFVPLSDCMDKRVKCVTEIESILKEHTEALKNLDNFARWFLQDKGLKIVEINEILEGKK